MATRLVLAANLKPGDLLKDYYHEVVAAVVRDGDEVVISLESGSSMSTSKNDLIYAVR